jgi:hypothetical protein
MGAIKTSSLASRPLPVAAAGGRENLEQKSDLMTHLLIARPDEWPSFQGYFDPSLILIVTISCLGLLVSLCAAICGLDLSASLL